MSVPIYQQPNQGQIPGQGPKILSCTSCRQRKIKCNKTNPCLPCQASGSRCIFPTRARNRRPRMGSKARDAELLRRISQLESIVKNIDPTQLTPEPERPSQDLSSGPSTPPSTRRKPGSTDNAFGQALDANFATFKRIQEGRASQLNDGFWTSLNDEFDGMRQLLEDQEDDDDEPTEESEYDGSAKSPSSHFTLSSSGGNDPSEFDISQYYPSREHRDILFKIYFANVDPVCKVVHTPTNRLHFNSVEELLSPVTGRWKFGSIESLAFSMYFAAVTSISDEECMSLFGQHRDVLVARYRRCAETSFSQADFLNSMEQLMLQSFIVYLVTLRAHDKSRMTWTLVGLVIRIAYALGIHRDGDGQQFIVFEAEIRRRLWWAIVMLDVRASEDRGTEPMIQDGTYNTKMPENIDESDVSFRTKIPLISRTTMTDMTYTVMSTDVANTLLRINFVPAPQGRKLLGMQEREYLVQACTDRISNMYLPSADPSNPIHWTMLQIGQLLTLKLWLALQYPLQSRNGSQTASASPSSSRKPSLSTAVTYLQLHDTLTADPRAQGFAWLFKTYVPWHALAVALAELCVETTGPTADKAWRVIETGYDSWSSEVADGREGVLWRPVRRLLKRARAARDKAIALNGMSPRRSIPTDIDSLASLKLENEQNMLEGIHGYAMPHDPNVALVGGIPGFQDQTENVNVQYEIPYTPIEFSTPNWDDWNLFVSDVGGVVGMGGPPPWVVQQQAQSQSPLEQTGYGGGGFTFGEMVGPPSMAQGGQQMSGMAVPRSGFAGWGFDDRVYET